MSLVGQKGVKEEGRKGNLELRVLRLVVNLRYLFSSYLDGPVYDNIRAGVKNFLLYLSLCRQTEVEKRLTAWLEQAPGLV